MRRSPGHIAIASLLAVTAAAAERNPGVLGIGELPPADEATAVTVTWYGVATLLFDDGETKILIDGFFSRPDFGGEARTAAASPDLARIDRMIADAGLEDLAMIAPVHSHFDHAMDVGVVAKLTGARVVGSETTANIARGAGVPEDQIDVVDLGATFRFGAFEVSLVKSKHAPLGADGGPPIPGVLTQPIVPPAGINDWKEGGSYSIVIAHPAGTAIVQGSAGFEEGNLAHVDADVVYLGIGGLGALGSAHTMRYWRETVSLPGAGCVFPVHWDDFFKPFGVIEPSGGQAPADVIEQFAALAGTGVELATLPLGVSVDAFPPACLH